MNAQHTPGPWVLIAGRTFETSDGQFYLAYDRDALGNAKFRSPTALDANARLIAAAPELLEALRFIASCECEDEGDEDHSHLYSCAREAIAKATGRARP